MKRLSLTTVVLAGLLAGPVGAQPLGTAFTYQGRLQDAGVPASGPYDFRFILFDAAVGGSQVGAIVTRDDVAVTGGLFTASLDFGTSAFMGDKRWLDVAVRPGASTVPYTPLSERQELQAAPHSAFSLRSPWTGIAGKPPGFADDIDNDTTYTAGVGLDLVGAVFSLEDLGVTTAKLANLAVGTVKLADGAVTSAKIADGTVALADLGQNGCLPTQILKWNGLAWACAFDLDSNSGGTVTSVATGAGLTGGPISTAGTVSVATGGIINALLANGAVTSAKIASGAIGLSQINTAEVQARVATTCPPGQYLRGINTNGTVVCEPFHTPNVITTMDDPANSVGQFTSIAIGADGLPLISYYDQTVGDLKVAHCGNAACTIGKTLVTVDPDVNVVGLHTSIAIGADGLPVIAYQDVTAGDLKVAHCGDLTCSADNTTVIVDPSPNSVGPYTSIAIGTDGFPIISYYDSTGGDLKVAHCGNATCTAGNTAVIVDSANVVGLFTSIAIGADGLPVISYYDQSAGDLKVAHCGNVACTSGNTIATVDAANNVGRFTSIAIGTDDLPVIAYQNATAGDLKVAHCGNVTCTAGNTLNAVDTDVNTVGEFASIEIGTDGLPVISYWDGTGWTGLKVAHCGNAHCSAGNTLAKVYEHPTGFAGQFSSLAIGSDGLPVISLYLSAGALQVAKCATRTCQ